MKTATNNSTKIETIFSFDVELYFGRNPGTTEKNIIEPVTALLDLASKKKIPLTFFFDAGHLNFLERFKAKSVSLSNEYNSLAKLLLRMKGEGHDVQLHVHPHWEDAKYDGGWQFNTTRFSPVSFDQDEFIQLFGRYKNSLDSIIQDRSTSFRAGGFCLHANKAWNEIFTQYGIEVDSSVYFGGYENSPTHFYDFRTVPKEAHWHFIEHPTSPIKQGRFLEVPVTSMYFNPLNFLKILAARKLSGDQRNGVMGDGQSTPMSFRRKLVYLLKGDQTTASVDSGKSGLLTRYREDCTKRSCNLLHLIGHPKAISKNSLIDIERYCDQYGSEKILSLSAYARKFKLQKT
jgi:hypothetical protein